MRGNATNFRNGRMSLQPCSFVDKYSRKDVIILIKTAGKVTGTSMAGIALRLPSPLFCVAFFILRTSKGTKKQRSLISGHEFYIRNRIFSKLNLFHDHNNASFATELFGRKRKSFCK